MLTRHFDQQQQYLAMKTAYQCSICHTVLLSIEDIRKHMEDTHPELQSMFCAKMNCAQIVSNEEQLKCHWDNKHSKFTYQCLKCFKRFENEYFIENHMQNAHNVKIIKTEENEEEEEEGKEEEKEEDRLIENENKMNQSIN